MSEILDEITEFERLWEKIKGRLVTAEFKTPVVEKSVEPKPKSDLPPVEYAGPTKSELQVAGVDVELLDFLNYGNTLKPKKFLGDLWSDMNQKLTANNYVWVKEGKESRWEFQYGDADQKQPKPSPTVTSRPIKTDEIKWSVKDGAKIVEARATDPKTWAFVKKYDRDAKKSTDEVKSENVDLYEFLKINKEYIDGTYRYTMSKDEAFFNREKLD